MASGKDEKTDPSEPDKRYPFESLCDESSDEETVLSSITNNQGTAKTGDEKSRSTETEIRYQFGSIISSESLNQEVCIGIGLPDSSTSATGTKKKNDTSVNQSLDGLSSDIDTEEASKQ
ncbi:uncharacterized protein LOC124416266 [Diprion similis]|uniref:uncharacterized protein LOC124416266 n=1 Tax=Diprion similis TaxID=362088 RepID=UPI001EF8FD72|nr:uncharacterized protein LOC124416266 [Diprion similis]